MYFYYNLLILNNKKLKEIRKKLGLTQSGLADLIGRTSMRTVQNWEKGINRIPDFVEDILNQELHKLEESEREDVNDIPEVSYEILLEEYKKINERLESLEKQNLQIIKFLADFEITTGLAFETIFINMGVKISPEIRERLDKIKLNFN